MRWILVAIILLVASSCALPRKHRIPNEWETMSCPPIIVEGVPRISYE